MDPELQTNTGIGFSALSRQSRMSDGLGLWVTREIIERHGGTIQLVKREDGAQGAAFRVALKPPRMLESTHSPDPFSLYLHRTQRANRLRSRRSRRRQC